jgi:hypothetical protein
MVRSASPHLLGLVELTTGMPASTVVAPRQLCGASDVALSDNREELLMLLIDCSPLPAASKYACRIVRVIK